MGGAGSCDRGVLVSLAGSVMDAMVVWYGYGYRCGYEYGYGYSRPGWVQVVVLSTIINLSFFTLVFFVCL